MRIEGLYRLVDATYEQGSVELSSILHPSGFDQLMGKTIASALVDRRLHHAHVIVTAGESVRLKNAASGEGGCATRQLKGRGLHGHPQGILVAVPGEFLVAADSRTPQK
jgi:hypothetical protein